MGYNPSPILAVIRIHTFLKNSVYLDTHYICRYVKVFCKMYMDDLISLSDKKESAIVVLDLIAAQDPDGYLSWEEEFPEEGLRTPFLSSEIRLEDNGALNSRFYRKPQKKEITLHHSYYTKFL